MKEQLRPLIEVKRISKRFADGTWALKSVDLSVGAGEFILCAGRNGSGKTVCMRHLNGLYLPSEGEVLVNGISTRKDPQRARRTVGMVFQDADSQIVGQTVLRDVRFGPENLGLAEAEIQRRCRRTLRTMGLESLAEHRPHQLSGGEKRRLAIAGVLAMDPEVLILDEPFSNLDYPGVRSVLRHILDLHQAGRTLIVVSHEVEKIVAHVDRILIFQAGEIVEDGSPRSILPRIGDYGIRPIPQYRGDLQELSWLK